jgi:hypothetical protein
MLGANLEFAKNLKPSGARQGPGRAINNGNYKKSMVVFIKL